MDRDAGEGLGNENAYVQPDPLPPGSPQPYPPQPQPPQSPKEPPQPQSPQPPKPQPPEPQPPQAQPQDDKAVHAVEVGTRIKAYFADSSDLPNWSGGPAGPLGSNGTYFGSTTAELHQVLGHRRVQELEHVVCNGGGERPDYECKDAASGRGVHFI
eukprot:4589018-Pleurochrysis_carterae.AAC.6